MRACYICDYNEERHPGEKIPVCARCARVYDLPTPSRRRVTQEIEIPVPHITPPLPYPYPYPEPEPTPPF